MTACVLGDNSTGAPSFFLGGGGGGGAKVERSRGERSFNVICGHLKRRFVTFTWCNHGCFSRFVRRCHTYEPPSEVDIWTKPPPALEEVDVNEGDDPDEEDNADEEGNSGVVR